MNENDDARDERQQRLQVKMQGHDDLPVLNTQGARGQTLAAGMRNTGKKIAQVFRMSSQ